MNSQSREPDEEDPMGPRQESGAGNPGEHDSIAKLLTVLLRQRRTILILTLLGSVLVVIIAAVLPATWTSVTSFMPQGPSDPAQARLSTLAGQFGVNIGDASPGQSPEFYVDLMNTDQILKPIVLDTFVVAASLGPFEAGAKTGTLVDLLEIDHDRDAVRVKAAVNWLREKAIKATSDPQTGVVKVEVTTHWPEVSVQVADHLVALVNAFNLEVRQSRAQAERQFVEERLEGAQADLRAAEDNLQRFLQNNRAFQNSPELVFHHDRLQRQVAMAQQVYTSLAQSYEQARIGEVRNTPVITVIEYGQEPVQPNSKDLLLLALLGVVLGGALGVAWAIVFDALTRLSDSDRASSREMRGLWEETMSDVRMPIALIRRAWRK